MYNFKYNQSLCVFPWIHNYQGPRYARQLCCTANPDMPELTGTTEEEYMNSPRMKQIRLDMLEGKKIDACSNCYYREDAGMTSMRQNSWGFINARQWYEDIGVGKDSLLELGDISSMIDSLPDGIRDAKVKEYQEKEFDRLIANTDEHGHIINKPTYYDIRTIHCNLQCVSCGDTFSSEHINLSKKMGTGAGGFKPDYKFEDNTADEMIQGLKDKRINSLYWAGGEPFMSPLHWKVMEAILELRKNPEYTEYIDLIKVHYNTNLTKSKWKNKSIPEMLSKYKRLYIEASLDGVYETFEYTRDGANWKEVEQNWQEYYNSDCDMRITTVLSAPVIFDIDRYMNYWDNYPGLNIGVHQYHSQTLNNGFFNPKSWKSLATNFYPDDIIIPQLEYAIKRIKKSKTTIATFENGRAIQILQEYIKEKRKYSKEYSKMENLMLAKDSSETRDDFHKTTRLSNILKIVNTEAYEWYESIPPLRIETNEI